MILTGETPFIGEPRSAASAVVVVATAAPDCDTDELDVGTEVTEGEVVNPVATTTAFVPNEATLVVATFVAGAEAYFVHSPPNTSLQRAGYAVPPLIEKRSSVVNVAMLFVMYW